MRSNLLFITSPFNCVVLAYWPFENIVGNVVQEKADFSLFVFIQSEYWIFGMLNRMLIDQHLIGNRYSWLNFRSIFSAKEQNCFNLALHIEPVESIFELWKHSYYYNVIIIHCNKNFSKNVKISIFKFQSENHRNNISFRMTAIRIHNSLSPKICGLSVQIVCKQEFSFHLMYSRTSTFHIFFGFLIIWFEET